MPKHPDMFPVRRILNPWGTKSSGGQGVPPKSAVWDGQMYFISEPMPIGITTTHLYRVPPKIRNAWTNDEWPRRGETYGDWRERVTLPPRAV